MKTVLKILGAGLALLVITAIVVPFLVPAETLKVRVAEELSKATGRSIKIEGNASLKLFPDIAVSLENVSLGNPEGEFASSRMFFARKLDTGVRLMPLLNKEIIITGVTLDGAEIQLEQNKAGAKNWEFASKASSETKQEKTQEEGAAQKFAIGDIRVTDSSLAYSAPGAKPIEVSKIDLNLKGADGNAPLELDAAAIYRGEQVSVALDMKESRAFLGNGTSPVLLEVALPGGNISFNGTAKQDAPINANGQLKVNVAALPNLMKWATGNTPGGAVPNKVTLEGPVAITGKRVTFSDLKARADDISTSGRLTVDMSGSVPSIDGTLKLGVLDFAKFSKEPEATGAAPAAGGEGWSNEPMDLSGLKAVNAKLGLALDGVKMGKLEIGATAMDINLQGGSLRVGVDRMALYSGNAKGNASLSSSGIATALDITGVQIEPLMTALNGDSRLSGTAAMDLNLRGSGASQRAIVSSLGGNAKFSFRDGAIKGINLGQFLRDAKKGFLYSSDAAKTDFAELGASFSFANGIGTTKDIAMMAPILRMTGSGTIDLPRRNLDLKLLPTLVASSKGQGGKDKEGLTIPLNVTGPWTNPSVTPDLRGMVEDAIRDPENLKQNLKNIKDGIKDFNSPSDIGKALFGGGASAPATEPAATGTAPAATPATTAPAAPASPPTKQEQRQQAIEGLFNALTK